MRVFVRQAPVDLPPSSFVADGGEAVVHGVGDVAYKVFRHPVDPARLKALGRLRVPGALLPSDLLFDENGCWVGHTMPLLAQAVPCARLLARSYCDRHGVDVAHLVELVMALRERVEAVHRAGALVVDLHAGNVLLDERHRQPVLIDTSSWQLPGHPATAIQDGIRDRHAQGFDQGTDWFAFAVLTLHLLLGIHPYRGTHPAVKGLDARMQRRLSVLRPAVRRPSVCRPDDVVPAAWRRWYRAVLDEGLRAPPPTGPLDVMTWSPRPMPTARRLRLTPILRAPGPVQEVADRAGTTLARWSGGTCWRGGQLDRPLERLVVTDEGRAVGAWRADGRLHLWDLDRDEEVPCAWAADALACSRDGLVLRSGARLLAVRLTTIGGRLHALPHLLATVLPGATDLFEGIAVENLLGRMHLRMWGAGRCDTRAAPFLDGWTVLDAHHDRGVVALLATRDGTVDRWVLRRTGGGFDARHTPDVDTADLDLVCLPNGVCLLRTGQRLEIFRQRPGDDDLRTLEDPLLARGRLVPLEQAVGWVGGHEVHRMQLL